MTAAKTASQRGKANRTKGHQAERDVARYLRTVGFPQAERAVRTGYRVGDRVVPDPLDLTGIPGTVWSIKNDQRMEIAKWREQAECVKNYHGAELAILVVRRPRKAEPSRWWAWISVGEFARLVTGQRPLTACTVAVCMELGDLVPHLLKAGYGTTEEKSEE